MAGATAAGFAGLRMRAHARGPAGPRLTVGPIRQVGADGSKYFEPWIAANPRDASNMVIVGSLDLSKGSTPDRFHMEPAAWFSFDGGASWSSADIAIPADQPRERALFTDAYATFAPDGTVFCVFMGSPNGHGSDLWILRSEDGGRRWQGATRVPGFLDYPRLAADMHSGKPRLFIMANGPGDGAFFRNSKRPGYGCVVLRSDDGGRTVSAVNLLAPTTLLHTPIESPSILPDGRLLIGFVDFPDMPAAKKPQAHLTRGRIYTATSQDGGTTFSMPAPIRDTRLLEGYADGFVVIAVDQSEGPRKGRIYCTHIQSERRSARTSAPDKPERRRLDAAQVGARVIPWSHCPCSHSGLVRGACWECRGSRETPVSWSALSTRRGSRANTTGLCTSPPRPTAGQHLPHRSQCFPRHPRPTRSSPTGPFAATTFHWPHQRTVLSTHSGSTRATARGRSRRRGSRFCHRAEAPHFAVIHWLARVFLLQPLGIFVGPAVLLEEAKELLDLMESSGVFLSVLAVEQIGMEVGQQGVLRPIGCSEAVAQCVVGGGLGGDVLGGSGLDHLPDQGLGVLELLEANQTLGLGQSRLTLGRRAIGRVPSRRSSSEIASSWRPCLASTLARSTAARSFACGNLASSAMVASAPLKSPHGELNSRQCLRGRG